MLHSNRNSHQNLWRILLPSVFAALIHTPEQTVYVMIGIILETFSIRVPNCFVFYVFLSLRSILMLLFDMSISCNFSSIISSTNIAWIFMVQMYSLNMSGHVDFFVRYFVTNGTGKPSSTKCSSIKLTFIQFFIVDQLFNLSRWNQSRKIEMNFVSKIS